MIVAEGELIEPNLLQNDPPGSSFVQIVTSPTSGVLTQLFPAGTVRYTPSVSGPANDSFTYRVSRTGDPDCTGDGQATVSITNVLPVPVFTPTCTGVTCTFDAGDSHDHSGISTYSWNFGDESSINNLTAPVVSHTYAAGGIYQVTLTVSDGGLTAQLVRQVSVDAPPVAAFSASCDDLACTFDATAASDDGGIVTYRWDFGDGSAIVDTSQPTLVHAYSDEGRYLVTLTVFDPIAQTDLLAKDVYAVDFTLLLHLVLGHD